jgi:hypothetical protein
MDDDVLEPNCLEKQSEVLRLNPGIAVVCSDYHTIDDHGKLSKDPSFSPNAFRLWHSSHRESGRSFTLHYLLGKRRVGLPSSILFRREAPAAVKGFRTQAGSAADIDLWLQLCDNGDFFYLDKKLLRMRIHETNLLRRRESENDAYRDIMFIFRDNLKHHGRHLSFRLYKKAIFRQLILRLQPFAQRASIQIRAQIADELRGIGTPETLIRLLPTT